LSVIHPTWPVGSRADLPLPVAEHSLSGSTHLVALAVGGEVDRESEPLEGAAVGLLALPCLPSPRGAFLQSSVMYSYSGAPMHLCSGVDTVGRTRPVRLTDLISVIG
jgi:hypothetical protein